MSKLERSIFTIFFLSLTVVAIIGMIGKGDNVASAVTMAIFFGSMIVYIIWS